MARRLQVGACFVNAQLRSDARLPFGGTKSSGYGRELAEHGIHEFMNIPSVYIAWKHLSQKRLKWERLLVGAA